MRFLVLFGFIFLFFSCKKSTEDFAKGAIVKVYNNVLYSSDVATVIPKNISAKDSIDIAQKYIQKWITRELIAQKAIFNIGENDAEINAMVRDYKNSLVVKKYKEQLLEKKADIEPSEKEISTFYNDHINSYILNEDIVKGLALKIPNKAPKMKDLRTWLKRALDEDYSEIESYCYQHASSYDDFREKWVALKKINILFPEEIKHPDNLLTNKTVVEQQDSLFTYFFKITDLKHANENAPQSYVENNIITLLRHKNKLEFFNTFEKNIYNEGIKNETVTYNPLYE